MASAIDISVLVAAGLITLLVVIKVKKAITGYKIRRNSVISTTILYIGLASFFVVSSFFMGISITYLILYVLVFVAFQFAAYRFSGRTLKFWKKPDGAIYSRGALLINLVYVVSLVARFCISVIYVGSSSFHFQIEKYGELANQSGEVTLAIIIVDILMVAGSGLLVGLNREILRRSILIKNGLETVEELE